MLASAAGVLIGLGTLFAASFAAKFARDAAMYTRDSAQEAVRTNLSFIERERAHLKFINAEASSGHAGWIRVHLRFSNDGTGLAEVDAAAFDWCNGPAWPPPDLSLGEGLQVKVAGDTNGYVVVGPSSPVIFPALLAGYARYRTLTLDDCRTYFCISIDKADTSHGGPDYQATNIDLNGIPHDTLRHRLRRHRRPNHVPSPGLLRFLHNAPRRGRGIGDSPQKHPFCCINDTVTDEINSKCGDVLPVTGGVARVRYNRSLRGIFGSRD